ncbi:MAG: hypothetical protein AAFO81_03990 [Pseudomonadota bacterium]
MKAFAVTASIALALGFCSAASAHGEVDEVLLAEFEEHLDDFETEIDALVAAAENIASSYATNAIAEGAVAGFIEQWEAVEVHVVIENKATITYPGIWQGIFALQSAVDGKQSTADVDAAAKRLTAALWQGLGAVRLAASQVLHESAASASALTDGAQVISGPQTVDSIEAALQTAFAANKAGDLKQAETLVREAYFDAFEAIEGDLIPHDPDLVSQLEKDFNATLPLAMQSGDQARVASVLATMNKRLAAAKDVLEEVEASRSDVF